MQRGDLITSENWDHHESIGVVLGFTKEEDPNVIVLWLAENFVREEYSYAIKPVSINNFFLAIHDIAQYLAEQRVLTDKLDLLESE